MGDRVFLAFEAFGQGFLAPVFIDRRPGRAIGRAFQHPRRRVAFGHVVGRGQGVACQGLGPGQGQLPLHRLAAGVDTPLVARVAVPGAVDGVAIAGGVPAGRGDRRRIRHCRTEGEPEVAKRPVGAEAVVALATLAVLIATAGIGSAGPQRFLVELDALAVDPAEAHRSEAAVADRQGFRFPLGRGLGVPQDVGRRQGVGGTQNSSKQEQDRNAHGISREGSLPRARTESGTCLGGFRRPFHPALSCPGD